MTFLFFDYPQRVGWGDKKKNFIRPDRSRGPHTQIPDLEIVEFDFSSVPKAMDGSCARNHSISQGKYHVKTGNTGVPRDGERWHGLWGVARRRDAAATSKHIDTPLKLAFTLSY